jgi:hypothetical protein
VGGSNRGGGNDRCGLVGLGQLLLDGLLFLDGLLLVLLLLLLDVVLLLLALQTVEHATGSGAALGVVLLLELVLAVGRSDTLGLSRLDLGALLRKGRLGRTSSTNDVGSV